MRSACAAPIFGNSTAMLALLGAMPARPTPSLGSALHAGGGEESSQTYLFVASFTHGGTSLVNLLLSNMRDAAGLVHTHHPENEGQHLQRVWSEHGRHCREWPDTLCMSYFEQLEKTEVQRAKLAAAWEPYWSNKKAVLRVEKDPEFGCLFYKLAVFPSTSAAIVVMRHPYATHPTYTKACHSVEVCVSHWATSIAYSVHHLPRLKGGRHYLVMRLEALASESDGQQLFDLTRRLAGQVFEHAGRTGLDRIASPLSKISSRIDKDGRTQKVIYVNTNKSFN